jgi:hypothetical protein
MATIVAFNVKALEICVLSLEKLAACKGGF